MTRNELMEALARCNDENALIAVGLTPTARGQSKIRVAHVLEAGVMVNDEGRCLLVLFPSSRQQDLDLPDNRVEVDASKKASEYN